MLRSYITSALCVLVASVSANDSAAELGEAALQRLSNELNSLDATKTAESLLKVLGAQGGNARTEELPSELLQTIAAKTPVTQASAGVTAPVDTCLRQCGVLFTADWLTVLREPRVSALLGTLQGDSNPLVRLISGLGKLERNDRELVVDQMCKVQSSLARCLKACPGQTSDAALRNLDQVAGVCAPDVRNDYVEALPCLSSLNKADPVLACVEEQRATVEAVADAARHDRLDAACRAAAAHALCMRNAILATCSNSTTRLVDTMAEQTLGMTGRLLHSYNGELPEACVQLLKRIDPSGAVTTNTTAVKSGNDAVVPTTELNPSSRDRRQDDSADIQRADSKPSVAVDVTPTETSEMGTLGDVSAGAAANAAFLTVVGLLVNLAVL